ncbi:8347_t:CDS:2, partial [Ambispora leptoticha]
MSESKGNKGPVNHGPTLIIHGGAGNLRRELFELEQEYREALKNSLFAGHQILKNGGSSLDAVVEAVCVMEDSPLFNAGKGSVFTLGGKNELEASIMIGTPDHQAGAATLLYTVKNPIKLAKEILLDPQVPHVFLGAQWAEEYAKEKGLELVDPKYFWTERRWKQHMDGLEQRELQPQNIIATTKTSAAESNILSDKEVGSMGTVGAVAVDKDGIIAVATSTGGMNNKKDGRIGDTPMLAAGTWADNETCGVSGTGYGECFIRYAIVHDVAARVKYLGENISDAAEQVVKENKKVGGLAGVIVLDKYGNVAMSKNCDLMFRGYIRVSDERWISPVRSGPSPKDL